MTDSINHCLGCGIARTLSHWKRESWSVDFHTSLETSMMIFTKSKFYTHMCIHTFSNPVHTHKINECVSLTKDM